MNKLKTLCFSALTLLALLGPLSKSYGEWLWDDHEGLALRFHKTIESALPAECVGPPGDLYVYEWGFQTSENAIAYEMVFRERQDCVKRLAERLQALQKEGKLAVSYKKPYSLEVFLEAGGGATIIFYFAADEIELHDINRGDPYDRRAWKYRW